MPEFSEVADGLDMPLAEAMRTQRSVRRLRTDPVDDETIQAVLDLAVRAPTGSNAQSWEFVVIRDGDVKHQLARLNRQAFSIYRRVAKGRARGDLRAARMLAAVQWQADHFENAPVIVVACLQGRPGPTHLGRTSFYASMFPAVQNLLLAARSLGLGATLTTLPLWNRMLVRRTLGLPSGVTPCAVVPLGWPMRGGYGPTTRRPVNEVLHVDRYGNRPFFDAVATVRESL
ncbi:MAG: nitroreductase family protein [Acidimicrobiia bacterium]